MAARTHANAPAATTSAWVVGAFLSGGMAISVHALQLGAFAPLAAAGLGWVVEWPHSFHLWLLEGLGWFGFVFALAGRTQASRWSGIWSRQAPLAQALIVVAALLGIQLFLCIGFWLTRLSGVDQLGWLRAFFYLGGEFRPASLFSAMQLWLAAWLAWCCHRQERHAVWLFAAILCIYLGLDEWLSIHERLGVAARRFDGMHLALSALEARGLTLYGWQLALLPVVLVTGAVLFEAFRRITSRRELVVLVAGVAIFLGGAMGVESVEARGSSIDAAW